MPAFPKVKTSAKSVQTTRVVCTNFSRSLYRLQLKFAKGYAQGPIQVRTLTKISVPLARLLYITQANCVTFARKDKY